MRTGTAIILVSTLACAGGGRSARVEAPTIGLGDMGMALTLPKAMQAALDSLAPGFTTIRASAYRSDIAQSAAQQGGGIPALFATVGDFDGDGTQDAAVEGTKQGDTGLTVIAILNGATPRAIEVKHFAEFDADAVGIYVAPAPAGSTGGFEIVNYPDESTFFKWQNGAFQAAALP